MNETMEPNAIRDQKAGWKEIDNQHMVLIEKISSLRLSLMSPNRRDTQKQLIGDLLDFAESHFNFEENVMKEKGLSDYEVIREEHDAFVKKTARMKQKLDVKGFQPAIELLSFLSDWLQYHIQRAGIHYAK